MGKLLNVEFVGAEQSICLVTLLNKDDGADLFPWGTRVEEHRLSPPLIAQLNLALDSILANPKISCLIVTGEGKFFSNGMDLKYIDANLHLADELQKNAELLLARLLCFPVPTIAAVNGHMCAAGAMFGLAFDYRIMNSNRGLFFVPGVDIGLAYSPGMTSLLKSKLPVHMHVDMICFATRYTGAELARERVVLQAVNEANVLPAALEHASKLTAKTRFSGAKYRDTLGRIKLNTFKDAHATLSDTSAVYKMGFEAQAWDAQGRSRI